MGIFYPVRIPNPVNPNKGREPFTPTGEDNSVPVPGHRDWANKKKNKGVQTAFNKHSPKKIKNG